MTDGGYDFSSIETKWRKRWEETGLYRSTVDGDRSKHYALTMLPYTSGDLHIGHWYAIAPSDVRARFMRMKGYNVLFPIGFDAFGLPAENAAIQRGVHPFKWTMDNVEQMREQLKTMGTMFDWEREAITCVPEYYRWTQWLFLQFYKHGQAYRQKAPVDWCPGCNTTLAREQVQGEDRHCERCETPVVVKELDQWLLRITNYAEELLDFSGIDWSDRVVTMQNNWIGRSEGVEFEMRVKGREEGFRVFTTRPDTTFGMTFAVLAPEHPLVARITTEDQRPEVEAYTAGALRRSEIERLSIDRARDGVFTGACAINPMNDAEVPIYIADYVLTTYGTGAIMAVPAHDERDFNFAKRYDLPIRVVIAPPDWDGSPPEEACIDPGRMVNSGRFDGLSSEEGWEAVADDLEARGIGERKVNYRLHDWLISRQRYWGCPIPMVYCSACATVPVPEEDLPVLLPEDAEFLPTGESPPEISRGLSPYNLSGMRWRCRSGDRYDGYLHVFVMVSISLSEPPLQPGPLRSERGGLLAAGGPVHRRHRTRHNAPALHPVLHQSDAGYGVGGRRRTDGPALQPGDCPGRGLRKDEQVPGQCDQSGRVGGPLWCRQRAYLPDVLQSVGPGRAVELFRHGRHAEVFKPCLVAGGRAPAGG